MRRISKGTLRRLYARFLKDANAPFNSLFKGADSFKVWCHRNVVAIRKYYKEQKREQFTDAAAAALLTPVQYTR